VKYHEYYTLRVAQSKNNVPIRLTYKQWAHVVDSHDYMAGNMDNQDKIQYWGEEYYGRSKRTIVGICTLSA
jgi:hypothetical protein